MTHSHKELVEIARRWLLGAGKCGVAFTEWWPDTEEIPDALGFRDPFTTVLIECKTNRADFLADRKKPFRLHPQTGLGLYRFYLAPTGLIQASELPEKWGLITVSESGRTRSMVNNMNTSDWQVCRKAMFEERNTAGELRMLYTGLRRVTDNDCWHATRSARGQPTPQVVTR